MTDYAKAAWAPSPNFTPGRAGHNPNWTPQDPNTWIVLHTMVGTEAAARARFMNPAQQASSNYGVRLDGTVVQYVLEKDAAWANGTYANNPGSNLDSISIEHEDDGAYNGPRTPQLYEASAQLVADIAHRRGIPLIHRGTGGGVLRHRECNGASTACPDSLDVDRIIARANQILHPPPPAPVDTRPEWQKNLVALPLTVQLASQVPIVSMATNADTTSKVGPGTLTTAYETSSGGVKFYVTQYAVDHATGQGLRETDVRTATAQPPPVVIPTPPPVDPIPPVTPPVVPPVTPPTTPPAPPNDLWPWLQALLDFFRKVFKA